MRRHGSSVKHQAKVYAVGHDCDLAVLTVEDPEFWVSSAAPAGLAVAHAALAPSSAAAAPAATAAPATAAANPAATAAAAAATDAATAAILATIPATTTTTAVAAVAAAATEVVKRVRPLPIGDVPHLQEQVTVMGFPQGGRALHYSFVPEPTEGTLYPTS